jgi:phosphoglycerol transferase MdoB-like AlkP superfamily enzyme
MYPKATLVEQSIFENTMQPKFKNVLQISIYNNGTMPFTINGRSFANDETYHVDSCGAAFDFDINKLKFTGANTTENHAVLSYHVLIEDDKSTTATPNNC